MVSGFFDYGLYQLGSWTAGENPIFPGSISFGDESTAFNSSNYYLGSEFLRKPISWSFFNNNPVGNVVVLSTEGNGSNFQELGLSQGDAIGSDVLTRDFSAAGLKNNTFEIEITQTIRYSRPGE